MAHRQHESSIELSVMVITVSQRRSTTSTALERSDRLLDQISTRRLPQKNPIFSYFYREIITDIRYVRDRFGVSTSS